MDVSDIFFLVGAVAILVGMALLNSIEAVLISLGLAALFFGYRMGGN